VVSHPTQHKIGHFRDVSPSQSLGMAWKKLNITQQKHTFSNQNLRCLASLIPKTVYDDSPARQHTTHTHTHTRLTALFPGLPRWAGTRKVTPIWISLNQETVSGSGISWAIYKSASRSSQITILAPHCSVFYRPDALPAAQPTASKHWRHQIHTTIKNKMDNTVLHRTQGIMLLISTLAQISDMIHTGVTHPPTK